MMNFQDTRKYSGAYSVLSKYRTIVLSEDLTKETAATLCSLLIYYNSLSVDEEIKILIRVLNENNIKQIGFCTHLQIALAKMATTIQESIEFKSMDSYQQRVIIEPVLELAGTMDLALDPCFSAISS